MELKRKSIKRKSTSAELAYARRYYNKNRERALVRAKEYREKNLEYLKQYRRARRDDDRAKRYGITKEDFLDLLNAQHGRCAICEVDLGTPTSSWGARNRRDRAAIDHDHTTGKVRGLLCQPCNMGLGGFRDAAKNLLAAVRYLKKRRE